MVATSRLSICEFTTMPATFEEDLTAYAAAGVDGIGVCELKLEGVADPAARLREAGLSASICVPAVPSLLPVAVMPGPEALEERVEALCESVHRLAELEPACVLFFTGPGYEGQPEVLEGVRRVAEAGAQAGVRVALEPMHSSMRDILSPVRSVSDAVAVLEAAGAEGAGVLVDTWQIWDQPARDEELVEHASRIFGVHVADRREPTRSMFDRVLPGEGVIDLAALLRVLEEAGYDGWYDVEIFSDNGVFGDAFEDSLWDVPAPELARRVRASFETVFRD